MTYKMLNRQYNLNRCTDGHALGVDTDMKMCSTDAKH